MIASTPETKTNGSGREVPIPSVSLGLGNDLDPKFGRWVIVGSIVGFLVWAVNFPEAMPGHDLFHQRGPTQVVTLIMGGMLSWFLLGKLRILRSAQKAYLSFDLEIPNLVRHGDLEAIKLKSEHPNRLRNVYFICWTFGNLQVQHFNWRAGLHVELYELSMSSSLASQSVWAIPYGLYWHCYWDVPSGRFI